MSKMLEKPVMRNFWATQLKYQFAGGIIAGLILGGSLKVFYCDRRKKAYDDFYRTYDDEKQLKIMEDAGLLQSCPK